MKAGVRRLGVGLRYKGHPEIGRKALQAAQIVNDDRRQVWARQREDGSRAIGLFNLSRTPDKVAITWVQLGLKGPQRIRDVWRQQDIGMSEEGYTVELPRHGAIMIRVWPATK